MSALPSLTNLLELVSKLTWGDKHTHEMDKGVKHRVFPLIAGDQSAEATQPPDSILGKATLYYNSLCGMVIDRYKTLDLSLLIYWLWFLTTLGIGGCDQIINSHEKAQSIIQQADAQLVYERSISLSDNGPVLRTPISFAVANGAFYIIDYLHKAVFEYDLEGQYIRTIGHQGKGEGEYLFPMDVEVGLDEKIYVYDGKTAKLNAYNQAGRFVDQPFENYRRMVGKFVVDVQGSSLQLISAQDQEDKQIVQLAKVTPGAESPEVSIDIAKGAMSILFIKKFGLCYNPSRQHIYYMLPWDYRIVEVDMNTGKQVRRFGIEPPNFRQLDISSEIGNLDMVEKPRLMNITLLGDTLLFVRFTADLSGEIPNLMMEATEVDPTRTFCVLYDLTDENKIMVRKVKDPSNKLNYKAKIRSVDQLLYVYSPPYNIPRSSNGRIDVYSFDFNRSL